jgi:septal ring factor EnvC (AmiA/AmiB activator)
MNKLNNFMTVKEISNLLNVSDQTVRRIVRILYPAKMEKCKMTKLSKDEADKVIGEIRIEIKSQLQQNVEDLQQNVVDLTQNVPNLVQNVSDLNNRMDKIETAIIDMASGIKLLSNSIQQMAKNMELSAKKEPLLISDDEEYLMIADYCYKNRVEFGTSEKKRFNRILNEMYDDKEIPVRMKKTAGLVFKYYPVSVLREIFNKISEK